jgi:hypothetical protein
MNDEKSGREDGGLADGGGTGSDVGGGIGGGGVESPRGLAGWWRARSRQEKWMMVLIVVLIIGVGVRWSFFRREAGAAFRERIEHFKRPTADTLRGQADSLPTADSL